MGCCIDWICSCQQSPQPSAKSLCIASTLSASATGYRRYLFRNAHSFHLNIGFRSTGLMNFTGIRYHRFWKFFFCFFFPFTMRRFLLNWKSIWKIFPNICCPYMYTYIYIYLYIFCFFRSSLFPTQPMMSIDLGDYYSKPMYKIMIDWLLTYYSTPIRY